MRAYASRVRIPLEGAAIAIQSPEGELLAARLTDRSGMLSEPVVIETPMLSAGQEPGSGTIPFRSVTILARKDGYEQIEVENVQVFPDTVTFQNLEMIPLSELPGVWDMSEFFQTPPQNL